MSKFTAASFVTLRKRVIHWEREHGNLCFRLRENFDIKLIMAREREKKRREGKEGRGGREVKESIPDVKFQKLDTS